MTTNKEQATVSPLRPDAKPVYRSITEALAGAQAELINPPKTRTADTGKYKYQYADIGDVLDTVRPCLARHGIALTQPTVIKDGTIVLKTVLSFGPQTIESEYPVCSLNGNHQAMGAAMTYARRYALTSLVGIAAVDDTDGEGAAPSGEGERVKLTAHQAKKEINWPEIQASIDNADTFEKLAKLADVIEQRKGFWPDTYYHKARERVLFNRLELADAKLKSAKDIDSLNDIFAGIEGALDGAVQWDEISAIYKKYEVALFDAEFNNSPLAAG